MDRPGRDPLSLMDEVATTLDIRTVPLNWPIGTGQEFKGVLDRRTDRVRLFERVEHGASVAPETSVALDDASLPERLGDALYAQLLEEAELLSEAGDPWDIASFLAGDVTPFFFGSAMTNFGVQPLLDAIEELAPSPRPRPTVQGERRPEDPDFSAFVFKIQANMNPKHRDRIAFMRVVSGAFERGMEVTLARTGRTLRLSKPHTFLAAERSIVDDAVPGDIVGLYDPGELRIGDTLAGGAPGKFQGIPRFAPEHFARVRLKDPTRRKHLQNGLLQLSQEGTIQLFIREGLGAADPYLGAVGLLQFEVLKVRLELEYNVKVELEPSRYQVARWITGDPRGLEWLERRVDYAMVTDRDGQPVVLAETPWSLNYALQEAPGLVLLDVSPLLDG
jgi:peptide chain release factor 3